VGATHPGRQQQQDHVVVAQPCRQVQRGGAAGAVQPLAVIHVAGHQGGAAAHQGGCRLQRPLAHCQVQGREPADGPRVDIPAHRHTRRKCESKHITGKGRCAGRCFVAAQPVPLPLLLQLLLLVLAVVIWK
jgi:hypothetical protein